MIGMLTGTVLLKGIQYLLIDVHGVGYKVLVSQNVLANAKKDQQTSLYTHTYVREDVLELYGFPSIEELQLFEQLINVSGVGCKTALSIFSIGTKEQIVRAIVTADTTFFTQVPRLGKKNSQRIIIDLKNKVGEKGEDLDLTMQDNQSQTEVIAALKNFGFTTQEAQEAIRALQGQGETPEEKIRMALKHLGK